MEHPVTELVTGLDLVQWQLRIAAGERLTVRQEDVRWEGSAIECRIYAEDPAKNFLPSPGRLTAFEVPNSVPGVRIDTGFRENDAITHYYDPMIAKVIAHGSNRAAAISAMVSALEGLRIEGLKTNIHFLRKVLVHPEFRAGNSFTRFVDTYMTELLAS